MAEASPQKIKIATNARFIGDLFADDILAIQLYRSTKGVDFRDSVLVDYVYDHSNARQKLAEMMDCGDGLGI